jgi:hypothetical protein
MTMLLLEVSLVLRRRRRQQSSSVGEVESE